LIEAGACGIPVIGTDSGAIPDVVGEAGIIAKERNPKELAGAIERLSLDPDLGARMGGVGRRQAIEHYSWQRVGEQLVEVYRRVLRNQTVEPSSNKIETAILSEAGA
jgi:glycosyltransferase involved in cell wall biosynthesis